MINNESDPELGPDPDPELVGSTRPALEEPQLPPNPQPGDVFNPGNDKDLYRYCHVSYGRLGSRWAYWSRTNDGRSKVLHTIIVDCLYDPSAAGQLIQPYDGHQDAVWVKIQGWQPPEPTSMISIEPLEKSEGRYERNDIDRIDRIDRLEQGGPTGGLIQDANNKEDHQDRQGG